MISRLSSLRGRLQRAPHLKSLGTGAAFGLYAVILGLVLTEIGLRLLYSDPDTYFDHRYLFARPQTFQNVTDTFWTYGPAEEMRNVAVYGFSDRDFHVEYDCTSPINSLGLPQEEEIPQGARVFALIGDSYTLGSGGCPWVPRLQARYPDIPFLNGGLLGTGIAHWQGLLKYLRRHDIRPDPVLIIAISNDFVRPPWIWQADQLACLNEGRACDDDLWYPLPATAGPDDLTAIAKERARRRHPQTGPVLRLWRWFERSSYVVKWAKRNSLIRPLLKRNKKNRPVRIVPQAQTALDDFRALGVPLHILMIPQRDEVGLKRKNFTSRQVENLLAKNAIDFSWCPLTAEDYMPLDAHPNRQGYDKIIACIARLIDSGFGAPLPVRKAPPARRPPAIPPSTHPAVER